MNRPTAIRWRVLALLVLASFISYVLRYNLSTAGPEMMTDLGITEQQLGYILAAFGLVAGLAWNDAIKAAIDYFFPAGSNTVTARFIYAIGITIVVVVLASYLARFMKKEASPSQQ